MEQQVLSGLRTGNAILKELQGEMRVEEVEELMADTAEAIAYQNEISAMLSGKMTSEEEEDVLAELEGLQGEVMEEMLPKVPEHHLNRVGENKHLTFWRNCLYRRSLQRVTLQCWHEINRHS